MSATAVVFRVLEWDALFWRMPMVEFRIRYDDPHGFEFVQLLADVGDTEFIQWATENGHAFIDVRVTLDRRTAHGFAPLDIRFYEETDLPHLVRIARESHRATRYYADPGFPDERCHDLYETWIRNSVDGWSDCVLVAGVPAHGYCTVHLDGDTASIGLIAVDEAARGQGVGYRLVHGAIRWAHGAGAEKITVVTQGRNVQAQRLFQRCGFRTSDTQIWLHKHCS